MKELAKLILEVSTKANESWKEGGPCMSMLVSEHCPPTPEGHLTCMLLVCCWNDAIGWAEQNQ